MPSKTFEYTLPFNGMNESVLVDLLITIAFHGQSHTRCQSDHAINLIPADAVMHPDI